MIIQSLLVGAGIFSLAAAWYAWKESEKIKANWLITLESKRKRSLGFFLSAAFFAALFAKHYDVNAFAIIIYLHTIYWVVFDLMLNKLRGLPIDYMPDPNENSSLSDDLFSFYLGWHIQITMKAILLIISLIWIL